MSKTGTETRVKHMQDLWADGWSASQIARSLGGITRNAVIGKIHRLGIQRQGPSKPVKVGVETPQVAIKKGRNSTRTGLVSTQKIKARRQRMSCDQVHVEAKPKHISLMDLNDKTCRFPYVIDGVTTFCGCQKAEGSVYCAFHHNLCTNGQVAKDQI